MKTLRLSFFLILSLLITAASLNAQWKKTAKVSFGEIRCLAFKDTNIYAGTYGGGVFVSNNNGASWNTTNSGLSNLYIKSLSVSGQNIFAGSDGGGVFKSGDNGATWSKMNNGLADSVILTLSFDNTLLFAGSLLAGIFKSTDDGATWAQSNNGLTDTTVNVLTVIDTNIYAGTWGGGIFVSTNKGGSWSGIFNDSLKSKYISGIAAIDTNLFVGTVDGWVFQHSPNYNGWIQKDSGLAAVTVFSLLANNKNLFAGTSEGVFAFLENDTSWKAVNDSLSNSKIYAMAVHDSLLFIGTELGVWYRRLSDFAVPTSVANNHSNLPDKFTLNQNYPNPFNPATTISYTVNKSSLVSIKIYDVLGREIETLVDKYLLPGVYKTEFNAKNLASGVYFYRLQAENYALTKKMVLIK